MSRMITDISKYAGYNLIKTLGQVIVGAYTKRYEEDQRYFVTVAETIAPSSYSRININYEISIGQSRGVWIRWNCFTTFVKRTKFVI